MGKGRKKYGVDECVTAQGAARHLAVHHTTIKAAVERGELTPIVSADGLVALIPLEQVDAWGSAERKRGPKPKADK